MPSARPTGPPGRPIARICAFAVAALVVASMLPALGARAQEGTAHLELRSGRHSVTAEKYGRGPIYLDLGVYVAAIGGPFEVWLTRPDYSQPVEVARKIVADDGEVSFEALPEDLLDEWEGFEDFFRFDISQDGELVKSKTLGFCPNAYDRQRISDAGPKIPTYPDACYGGPFTKGFVWGIDEDWAANATTSSEQRLWLRKGVYDLKISVEPRYAALFGFPDDASSVDLELEVTSYEDSCPKCGRIDRRDERTAAEVPIVSNPSPDTLPDLAALPAWNISIRNRRKGELMSFGATVWAAGAQSLIVEGFRRENQELMDAYQYFYKDGEPIGRARVGEMEYDARQGHEHWHFLQFARYSLLDSTKSEILKSKKEAFCLAPTDAIDLTLPGVRWSQELGLTTACGSPGALWVREVLPLGFGDTYGQSLPGQAFDVTDLPNGTYYIAVTANPLGSLYEQTTDNNVELREIIIKGKAGERRVKVPPWNGIDTENYGNDGHGGVTDPH